jgi:hypothetical protein
LKQLFSFLTRPIDGWKFLGFALLTGFCGYLLSNFSPISTKAMSNVFYFGCALPALAWVVKHRPEMLAWLQAGLALWLFFLVMVMSALLKGDLGVARAVFYVFLLGLAILALHTWDARAEQWLFSWLAAISVAVLVWATYAWVELYSPGALPLRIQIWDKNPIHTALIIVSALAYLWEFHLEPKVQHLGKLAYVLGSVIFSLLVIWSTIPFQARGALLGYATYWLLKLSLDNRRWYLLGGLSVVVMVGWLLGWDVVLETRGFSYRPEIWSDAWRRLTQDCGVLAGCGNDGYKFAGEFPHAHSAYLMLLYKHGLIVFLPFVLFAVMFFRNGFRNRSRWMLVAAVGWGGVLTNTPGVVHSPQPYWIYFWMPTFLAMLECWRVFTPRSSDFEIKRSGGNGKCTES